MTIEEIEYLEKLVREDFKSTKGTKKMIKIFDLQKKFKKMKLEIKPS
jgi:hypothetical protein